MKDIRLAFRALLLADPTVNSLVGGTRVYPVRPPQTQRAPSLVYLRIIDFSDYNMLGDSGLQRTSMQLDAWADTHDASVQLADAAHDAITGFSGRAVYGSNSPQDYIDIRGIFQNIGRDLDRRPDSNVPHEPRLYDQLRGALKMKTCAIVITAAAILFARKASSIAIAATSSVSVEVGWRNGSKS